MSDIRESSLFLTIDEFLNSLEQKLDKNENIEQDQMEEFLDRAINRDRDYMSGVYDEKIINLQRNIDKMNHKINKLLQIYVTRSNEIHMRNQELRKKVRESNKIFEAKKQIKKRNSQIRNLNQELSYWLSQFKNTYNEIKESKRILKNDLNSLRSDLAAISSNNLFWLREAKEKIMLRYNKAQSVIQYNHEQQFLKEKDTYSKKIAKYKKKNNEYNECFKDLVNIMGRFCIQPKLLILDVKRQAYEVQIAQEIKYKEISAENIAQLLKVQCLEILHKRDEQIKSLLEKRKIKEAHIQEKIRIATQRCQNPLPEKSPTISPFRSPQKQYTQRSVRRNLQFASWEDSSKMLDKTFDEIERLRNSRSILNSIEE